MKKQLWVVAGIIGLSVITGINPAAACGSHKCHTTTTSTTTSTSTTSTTTSTTAIQTTTIPVTTTTEACPYECESMGEDAPQTSSTSIVNPVKSDTHKPLSGYPMKMSG